MRYRKSDAAIHPIGVRQRQRIACSYQGREKVLDLRYWITTGKVRLYALAKSSNWLKDSILSL